MTIDVVRDWWFDDGLKGHPDCAVCQCYPECRIDCPDRDGCLDRLPEYQTKADRAKRYASAVRQRNPQMQVRRLGG